MWEVLPGRVLSPSFWPWWVGCPWERRPAGPWGWVLSACVQSHSGGRPVSVGAAWALGPQLRSPCPRAVLCARGRRGLSAARSGVRLDPGGVGMTRGSFWASGLLRRPWHVAWFWPARGAEPAVAWPGRGCRLLLVPLLRTWAFCSPLLASSARLLPGQGIAPLISAHFPGERSLTPNLP